MIPFAAPLFLYLAQATATNATPRRGFASAHSQAPGRPSRVARASRDPARPARTPTGAPVSAVQPWIDGQVYRLAASPGRISDVVLEAGEKLQSVAAGDTARWIIGDTASGSGAGRRVHILIKPSADGLRTNLVVATDRRAYYLEVESVAGRPAATLEWSYGGNALLALQPPMPSRERSNDIPLEALDFNYRIEGAQYPWRPLRAFSDGRQIFIEFPASLGASELPPLFVIGASRRPELVNYRLRGRFYVVDRLFDAAELRLGERHQQVVRILRAAPVSRKSS